MDNDEDAIQETLPHAAWTKTPFAGQQAGKKEREASSASMFYFLVKRRRQQRQVSQTLHVYWLDERTRYRSERSTQVPAKHNCCTIHGQVLAGHRHTDARQGWRLHVGSSRKGRNLLSQKIALSVETCFFQHLLVQIWKIRKIWYCVFIDNQLGVFFLLFFFFF